MYRKASFGACAQSRRTTMIKKNHYIEVTSPINIPGKKKIDGVILASVSTDSIEVTKQVFYTHGGVVVGIAAIFLAVSGWPLPINL